MWTNSLNKRSFAITKRFDFNENGWWRNSDRLSLWDARVCLKLRRRSERKYLITTEASKTRYPTMVNRLLNIWDSVGHGDTMGRASSGPIPPPPSTIPITHTSSIQHQEAKKTDTLPSTKLAGTLYASYHGYSPSKQRETSTLYPEHHINLPQSRLCIIWEIVLNPDISVKLFFTRALRCKKIERYQLLLTGLYIFAPLALLA